MTFSTKNLPIVFVLSLFSLFSFGQNQPSDLKVAHDHFEYKDYLSAIPIYEQVLASDSFPEHQMEVSYKTGMSYLQSSHKIRALSYLQEVYDQEPDYDPKLAFNLARAYHYNHRFDEAIQYYTIYLNKTTDAKEKEITKRKIEECNNGKQYISSPQKVKIVNLGDTINTPYPEYVPLILPDDSEMIFTARRPENMGGTYRDDGWKYEDIYISYKKESEWSKPEPIKRVNKKYHDACVALAPRGDVVFIYTDKRSGDLCYSNKKGDFWSKPKSLGKNINTKHGETSLTISEDEKTIYFTSNRPGGYGGFDIYKSTLDKNGKWGEAVNLGAGINTPYDEESPFLHDDNTLYFSSKGYDSMGGYDIYVSEKEGDSWGKPRNLGYPINTADNDIYFVITANNQTAYYSSAKDEGKGEQDIYMISYLQDTPPDLIVTTLKGYVKEHGTPDSLIANITLLKEGEPYKEVTSDTPSGTFTTPIDDGTTYNILVEKEGYISETYELEVPEATTPQTVEITTELRKVPYGAFLPTVVYFDYDKADLRDKEQNDLIQLAKMLSINPNLKLEINGHTDTIGNYDKNLKLSQNRSKVVFNFLVDKGVKQERLSTKGFSYSQPADTNKTPEGRQNNRRVEFKVVDNR